MEEKFKNMAESELDLIIKSIPVDPVGKMLAFIEMLRVYDYWSVYGDRLLEGQRLSIPEVELIQMGWRMAVEYFYVDVECAGLPIIESVPETRHMAFVTLMKLGRVAFFKKVAELIRVGLVQACEEGGRIYVRARGETRKIYMDNLEFYYASRLEKEIFESGVDVINGWRVVNEFDVENLPDEVGAFYGRNKESSHAKFKVDNVHELMESLIFPWDSGYGVMMGYDALPEVDDHFFTLAADLVFEGKEQVGLHPDAKLDKLDGKAVLLIVSIISSLHMKHAVFASLAFRKYKEITSQSLTIWTTRQDLIDTVVVYSGLDISFVSEIIDAVSFLPEDVQRLKLSNNFFVPLLFDMGNGMMLRPVSSLLRNPLISTLDLMYLRNDKLINAVSKPREEWFRKHLYYSFMGNRYRRVEGNIKIRRNGKILTDIDGVVYDTVSGELALFQLKWQDYFTHDVKSLRSKARNLASELEVWGRVVRCWLNETTEESLIKTLRLKLPAHMRIRKVFCFGLSWSLARVGGYGYEQVGNGLAVCNWPMFRRVRFKVGKVINVFEAIHDSILGEQEYIDSGLKSVRWETDIQGESIVFENLFVDYQEPD